MPSAPTAPAQPDPPVQGFGPGLAGGSGLEEGFAPGFSFVLPLPVRKGEGRRSSFLLAFSWSGAEETLG